LAVYYLDTSALVKLYVQEEGTAQMLRIARRSSGHMLAVLALTRVEFRAAVRRRQRFGDIPKDTAQEITARMERHLRDLYLVQPVTDAVIEEAAALLDRHALRAYDALQLAGCLSIVSRVPERPSFVCSDHDLLAAAEGEGLAVLDPVEK
jgi:predicted nucleic acid-binding protein